MSRELQCSEPSALLLPQSKTSSYSLIWNWRTICKCSRWKHTAPDSSPPKIKYGHSARHEWSRNSLWVSWFDICLFKMLYFCPAPAHHTQQGAGAAALSQHPGAAKEPPKCPAPRELPRSPSRSTQAVSAGGGRHSSSLECPELTQAVSEQGLGCC